MEGALLVEVVRQYVQVSNAFAKKTIEIREVIYNNITLLCTEKATKLHFKTSRSAGPLEVGGTRSVLDRCDLGQR